MKNKFVILGLSLLFSFSSLASENSNLETSDASQIEQEIYEKTYLNLQELIGNFDKVSNRLHVELNITALNSIGRNHAFWTSGNRFSRRVSCGANLYSIVGNYKIFLDGKLYDTVNFSGFTIDTDKRSLGENFPESACFDPRKFTTYNTFDNNMGIDEESMNENIRNYFSRDDIMYTRDPQQPGKARTTLYDISNSEGVKLKLESIRSTMILAERLPIFTGQQSSNFVSSKPIDINLFQSDESLNESLSTKLNADCKLSGDRSIPEHFVVVTSGNLKTRLTPIDKPVFYGESIAHLSLFTPDKTNSIFLFDDQGLLELLNVVDLKSNVFKKYDCRGMVNLLKSIGKL
ncbi:MAG: hypothetical protein KDD40_06685 [Bdellovibrionales bacterium]|nr:hypothetical protein [Bdellovibrionales bacterium]